MNKRKEYERDHITAKLIIAIVQISITVSLAVYIQGVLGVVLGVLVAKEFLYYFGTNTLQYIIEGLRKHSHKVPWL